MNPFKPTTKIQLPTLLVCLLSSTLTGAAEKRVIGWIEPITIESKTFSLSAKIDTGADSSSIYGHNIHITQQDGQPWVSFTIVDESGHPHHFEKPLAKQTKVKRIGSQSQQRPVIHLGFCLANHYKEAMVNITDRQGYKHPVLVGRNFLRGVFTVDPELQNTTTPRCGQ